VRTLSSAFHHRGLTESCPLEEAKASGELHEARRSSFGRDLKFHFSFKLGATWRRREASSLQGSCCCSQWQAARPHTVPQSGEPQAPLPLCQPPPRPEWRKYAGDLSTITEKGREGCGVDTVLSSDSTFNIP